MTCPPPPPFRSPPRRRPAPSASPAIRVTRVAAVLLALLLAALPAAISGPEPEAPDAGVPAPTPEAPAVLADAATWAPDAMASLPLPERAPEWQETRCDPKRDEVKLPNGGCYQQLARRPPCAEGQYEHAKACWAAVAKRTRPVQSLGK